MAQVEDVLALKDEAFNALVAIKEVDADKFENKDELAKALAAVSTPEEVSDLALAELDTPDEEVEEQETETETPSQDEPQAVPSIGGDVTPVFVDNSEGKKTPEWETRYKDGVESAKKQIAAAKKAEKAAAEKTEKKRK